MEEPQEKGVAQIAPLNPGDFPAFPPTTLGTSISR